MRLFKEEQVKEIFNDATIITTKKYFYYVSNEERMAHKIKMAIQGFSDSGQNVKTIKDSSIVPAGYSMIQWVMCIMDVIQNRKRLEKTVYYNLWKRNQ